VNDDYETRLIGWLAHLGGPDIKNFQDRDQAVAEMRAEGADKLFPLLVLSLNNPAPDVRCSACEALLWIDARRGLELVLPLLNVPDKEVRWYFCLCLSGCRDERAVDPLIQLSEKDTGGNGRVRTPNDSEGER
jgi:HEAT repeat protein